MHKKSISLIELLVAVAIFTVIIGTLYLLYGKGKGLDESLSAEADLLAVGRKALNQLIADLAETNRNTLTKDSLGHIPVFADPVNNEAHQILIFASSRGDSAVASEDGTHSSNNYAHIDASNRPTWRSAIIYYTFVAPDGTQQLLRYADYGTYASYYSQPSIFPLTLSGVTATYINLTRGDGSSLSIARNSGRVVSNYIATEDANKNNALDANENDGNTTMPADNQDNVLDRGCDFSVNGGLVSIKIFLARPQGLIMQGKRYLTVTLNDAAAMRN